MYETTTLSPPTPHTTHTVTDVERDSAGCDNMAVDPPVAMTSCSLVVHCILAGEPYAPLIIPPGNSRGVCVCVGGGGRGWCEEAMYQRL